MKLTLENLKEWDACEEAIEEFNKQPERDAVRVLELCVQKEKLHWANWLLPRILCRKDKIWYAVYAAQQVLMNYESVYPKDDRPRKAIMAALKVVDDDTPENREAARSADSAAESAGYVASSVWSATRSATRSATWSAAESAWSAARSARSAARSATWSAAESARSAARSADSAAESAAENAMKTKIILYGIQLLNKGEKK